MNVATVLKFKYPDSDSMRDWEVQDDSNGKGPYIATWNLPDPQPTKAELQAIWDSLEFQAWHKERQKEIIDIQTAQAIRESLHLHVPVDENLGILRDQLAYILKDQEIKSTKEFQNLQTDAEAEIVKGRKKKDKFK